MNTTDTHHDPTDIAKIAQLEKSNLDSLFHYQALLTQYSEMQTKYDRLYYLAAKYAILAGYNQALDTLLAEASPSLYHLVVRWRDMETHA